MLNGKFICNTRNNKIYASCAQAAKELKCSPATIWYNLMGRYKDSYKAKRYPIILVPANKIRYTLVQD